MNELNNNLASRWSRLWASLLDSIIMLIIALPVMYFTGTLDDISRGIQPSIIENLIMAIIMIGGFIVINGKLLISNGQTIGKKALGIKIVDVNGALAEKQQIIKRYAVYFLPGQIPVIGQLFSLVNILFIFSAQKRCIHDNIGGTIVIND